MSNILETKMFRQIRLNENFLAGLVKLFLKKRLNKQLKGIRTVAKNDPELQAALHDLSYHYENVQSMIKTLCDRHPDHPKCKGRK